MIEDPLGRMLVERQFIRVADCRTLLDRAESEGCFLEEILIRERVFSQRELLKFLENHHFCPAVELQKYAYDPKLIALIPRRLATRHQAFPLQLGPRVIKIALFDPTDTKARDAITQVVNRLITPLVALRHDLRNAIDRRYGRFERELASSKRAESRARQETSVASKPPVPRSVINLSTAGEAHSAVALVDKIIEEAARRRSTDIHIEPKEHDLVVRFRMDGVLFKVATLPGHLAASVISRIKVIGNMDISERRRPQDGRFTVRNGETMLDLRISSIPSQFGQKIVIRVLSKSMSLLDLNNLEMPPAVREGYTQVEQSQQGLFLVVGPTGSGKTTTLYATINSLDCESVNVVTLEDPIEYSMAKVTQVQVQEEIGLTFATGLRSFLRQDPDVILVGEIRDTDTVEIACRAALTGHKVLSTIHANGAAQAVPRLIDMGVPPYLVAATLKGVLAQRLVRVLCRDCREGYAPNQSELAVLGYPKIETLNRPRGCSDCSGTGFRGRMAIFEFLSVSESIHKLIFERASSFAIRHAAVQNGMISMPEFAKRAVLDGVTSVAEIQRTILSDEGHEQLCKHCGQVVNLDFAVCPFCKNVLKERCGGCQHPLDPAWEACPNCGREVESEARKSYCPHCLAPVGDQRELCPFCGGGLP